MQLVEQTRMKVEKEVSKSKQAASREVAGTLGVFLGTLMMC